MQKIISFITQYFRLFFIIAVGVGFALPQFSAGFNPYLGVIIFIATFLSALKINFSHLGALSSKRKVLSRFIFVSMILTPVLVYYITLLIAPEWALGAMILAAAPGGISCIAFADMVRANITLSIILTLVSSLVCPVSITILSYMFGAEIAVYELVELFGSLMLWICVPIVLAVIIKKSNILLDNIYPYISPIVILSVMPAIWGPIGANIEYFTSISLYQVLILNIFTFGLSIVLHVIGWLALSGQELETKATGSLSMGYMNLAIATIVALNFYGPEAILVVLMFELPRDLMLAPFSFIVKKLK